MNGTYDQIAVMQDYLPILRKIKGWTTETLGQQIGVTKQTISNLENKKVAMSKTQYIALRTIFEYEVTVVKDNIPLQRVIGILFYDNKGNDKDVKTALESVAAAASGGINGSQLNLLMTTVLGPLKISRLGNLQLLFDEKPYSWVGQLSCEEGESCKE